MSPKRKCLQNIILAKTLMLQTTNITKYHQNAKVAKTKIYKRLQNSSKINKEHQIYFFFIYICSPSIILRIQLYIYFQAMV